MVSNGYITREAFHDIYDHIDAANIDLKAFTEISTAKSPSSSSPTRGSRRCKWLQETKPMIWFEHH